MIRKTGGGYKVYSESGRALSRVYKRMGEATKRLREIEYFKSRRKGSSK